jgi:hypothetical protein
MYLRKSFQYTVFGRRNQSFEVLLFGSHLTDILESLILMLPDTNGVN